MQFFLTFLLILQLLNPNQYINNSDSFVLKEEISILMYHEVGTPQGPWKELYVEPKVFQKQLEWLKENGYTTVTLKEVYDHWYHKKPLPEKPIVITFDDGYRNMYNKVLPLLLSQKMKATFFLYPNKFNSSHGLTIDMVKEMALKGMEIGSHTYTHQDLTKLSDEKLKFELYDSKTYLENIIKKPVHFLCYPAGRFNQKVIKKTMNYNYLGAVTTKYGKASIHQNPYQLKRIRINYSDGLKGFIKKLQ